MSGHGHKSGCDADGCDCFKTTIKPSERDAEMARAWWASVDWSADYAGNRINHAAELVAQAREEERERLAAIFEEKAKRDTDSLGVGIYGQGMMRAAEFIRALTKELK